MTEQQLIDVRRQRFRTAGNPVRTIEDARDFLADVGFCLMFPLRHPFAAPIATFVGAYIGSDEKLPYAHLAFADPRARDAGELMVRLLREKSAFEANIFDETPLVISADLFPYFYALIADKTPRSAPKLTGPHRVSPLALDIYKALEKHGALTKSQLKDEYLGGALSNAALDRALHELWAILKTTRTDYSPERGASWDLLARWAPEQARRGSQMSIPEALSALVSRYLIAVAAAEPKEVETFLGNFAPRSRVAEIVRALITARELQQFSVESRALVQVVPEPVVRSAPESVRRPKQPIKARGRRRG